MLNTHRHDDIFKVVLAWHGNQRGGGRITQGDINLIAFEVIQYIQQIGHVEADIDAVAVVIDFDFFDRFFLIGVGGTHLHAARCDHATNAFEFIASHDRCTLQRAQ